MDGNKAPLVLKSWNMIVDESKELYENDIILEDIFTKEEIDSNNYYITLLRKEFYELNKLDKSDFVVAGIIGTIAALLDCF